MDYSSIPLFNIMKTKLDYLSRRQGVLAQNIANADTPGYKARDISAPDFKKMLHSHGGASGGLRPMATHPGHMVSGGAGGGFKTIKRETTAELNPNGNNVAIEDEIAQAGQNQAEYQKALNLYCKTISLFKTAIGSTSGG